MPLMSPPMNLARLADALGLPMQGDANHTLTKLAPIDHAGLEDLSFVVSKRYAQSLTATEAGAVIVPPELADLAGDKLASGNYLISADPYASYAHASWLLKPEKIIPPGIHPTADVHPEAHVSELASIGACAVIGQGSSIEDHARIDAHCVIGDAVRIGAHTHLFPRVSLYDRVSLGTHCRIQSGAVIGSEGFGYAWTNNGWMQIQQTGGVQIGNRVHIGANSTIDCGAIDATVIADGVIVDNQVQIAHNVHIGENTAIAGCVGIAGSTRIGSHCQIGGACNIVGHITIADGVVLNAASLVTQSISEKGRYGSGTPLLAEHAWRRSFVNLGKLDALVKRVRQLERWSASNKS